MFAIVESTNELKKTSVSKDESASRVSATADPEVTNNRLD